MTIDSMYVMEDSIGCVMVDGTLYVMEDGRVHVQWLGDVRW